MTARWTHLVFSAVASLLIAACGGEDKSPQDGTPASTEAAGTGTAMVAEPTKAELLNTLRGALAAITAGDMAEAATHFMMPPTMSEADIAKNLKKMIEKRELSGAGIAVLQEKGTFGTLKEVFADRGEGWAGRAGVDVDRCYALSLDGAEVAAFWDGTFHLIRLDDVGKLK